MKIRQMVKWTSLETVGAYLSWKEAAALAYLCRWALLDVFVRVCFRIIGCA